MNDLFFRWMLEASVQLAVLVTLITVIVFFGRRMSARFRYALWTLVLIKALVPPFVSMPYSLANQAVEPLWQLFSQRQTVALQTVEPVAEIPALGEEGIVLPVIELTQEPDFQAASITPTFATPEITSPAPEIIEPPKTASHFPWLFAVWIGGVLIFWGVVLYYYVWATRLLAGGNWLHDGPIHELLMRLARQSGIRKTPQVVLSDSVRSPFLWGFWTPRIAIPADFPGEVGVDEMQSVLLHELTHWKRGDLFVARLELLVRSLFWFHPFVWFALRELRKERESACDETVLASGRIPAKQYGDSLLSVMLAIREPAAVPVGFLGFLGILEQKTQLQKRLEEIMSQQHHVKRIGLFGWGFLLFLILCVLPMAVAQNDPPKTEEKTTVEQAETGAEKTPKDSFSATGLDLDKIESVRDSVVMITDGNDEMFDNGIGAGVVLDPRGYILTTYHVIEGLKKIRVKTFEGKEYAAEYVNHDPVMDIALIKITPSKPLVPIRVGDSGKLRVLEHIVVLGHPFGYEFSFSSGEISGLNREITVNNHLIYSNMIQISAGINPGDSGGTLLNTKGEMIGLVVALRHNGNQIAFALPGNDVMKAGAKLLEQLPSQ